MTIIDDAALSDLFARAAEVLGSPESGPANILEKAFGPTSAPGEGEAPGPGADPTMGVDELAAPRGRRMARAIRTHRTLSAAASIVLVFVLVGTASWLGTTPARHQIAAGPVHGAPTVGNKGAVPSFGAKGAPTPGLLGPNTSAPPSRASGTGSVPGSSGAPVPTGSATSGSATTNTAPPLPNTAFQNARIAQTGSLSLTVKKGALTKTMTQLGFLASAYNGFVANSQTQTGAVSTTGAPSGTITLQVPAASFSDLLKKAQALGKTDDLTTKATDVTGQYVDLQTRIAALQASRQQYLTIMAKATSVGDVLAVQGQLDTIQSQIEQLQGQLNLLTSQTTYSTLTAQVTERSSEGPPTPPPHRSGLAKAWHDSVHGFVVGVEGIIRLAGPVLFTLLLGAALFFGGRVLWRRYQRHSL